MSRFQAKTNTKLEAALANLRQRLGLEPQETTELLEQMVTLTEWIVRQAEAGRSVVARGESGEEALDHPSLVGIQRRASTSGAPVRRVVLDRQETQRLAEILSRGYRPSPALLGCLRRLTDPNRTAPALVWPDAS